MPFEFSFGHTQSERTIKCLGIAVQCNVTCDGSNDFSLFSNCFFPLSSSKNNCFSSFWFISIRYSRLVVGPAFEFSFPFIENSLTQTGRPCPVLSRVHNKEDIIFLLNLVADGFVQRVDLQRPSSASAASSSLSSLSFAFTRTQREWKREFRFVAHSPIWCYNNGPIYGFIFLRSFDRKISQKRKVSLFIAYGCWSKIKLCSFRFLSLCCRRRRCSQLAVNRCLSSRVWLFSVSFRSFFSTDSIFACALTICLLVNSKVQKAPIAHWLNWKCIGNGFALTRRYNFHRKDGTWQRENSKRISFFYLLACVLHTSTVTHTHTLANITLNISNESYTIFMRIHIHAKRNERTTYAQKSQ